MSYHNFFRPNHCSWFYHNFFHLFIYYYIASFWTLHLGFGYRAKTSDVSDRSGNRTCLHVLLEALTSATDVQYAVNGTKTTKYLKLREDLLLVAANRKHTRTSSILDSVQVSFMLSKSFLWCFRHSALQLLSTDTRTRGTGSPKMLTVPVLTTNYDALLGKLGTAWCLMIY